MLKKKTKAKKILKAKKAKEKAALQKEAERLAIKV